MLRNFLLAGGVLTLLVSAPALAQSVPVATGTRAAAGTYTLQIASGSDVVSAFITTNSSGHATGISGLVDGSVPITGLSNYAGADNDLYSTGSWVTFAGLSFSTTVLGDFNFYNSGLGHYGFLSSLRNINGYPDDRVATAQAAAVPEPSTWLMMVLGFLAGGAFVRRGRTKVGLPQLA